MERPHIKGSSVPKMLVDPGKLYVGIILDLQLSGMPDVLIAPLLKTLVANIIEATVVEDRPTSERELRQQLSQFVQEVVSQRFR